MGRVAGNIRETIQVSGLLEGGTAKSLLSSNGLARALAAIMEDRGRRSEVRGKIQYRSSGGWGIYDCGFRNQKIQCPNHQTLYQRRPSRSSSSSSHKLPPETSGPLHIRMPYPRTRRKVR